MRLAICGLSAVLLSGCSWLGMGGNAVHQGQGGAYNAGCDLSACGAGANYGYAGYGQAYGADGFGQPGQVQAGYGAATGVAGGGQYAAAGYNSQGYAAQGLAQGGLNGYGTNAGVGYQGAYGVPGQQGVIATQQVGQQAGVQSGLGAFGNGTVTTIGGSAPYGAAVGGVYGQNVVGSQYAGGQFAAGQAVQTVQGAPIYVPQPYGVPVGVGVGGAGVAAAALPFGLALLGGTDFDVSGDVFRGVKDGPAKLADGSLSPSTNVTGLGPISYSDAFGQAARVGLALERDLGKNTTVFGQGAYSKANGQTVRNASTVQTGGSYDVNGNFVPGANPAESLDYVFGDLETYTAELGVRQYIGSPRGLRPYVGASAGATYNEDVNFVRARNSGGPNFVEETTFIESGWNPTAAGLIGAELPVGNRGAIGVESGVRWTDGLDSIGGGADDRISIPLTLRGRVAF